MAAIGSDDAPASASAAVPVASVAAENAHKAAREDVAGKKRRARPETTSVASDSTTSTTTAASPAGASQAAVAANQLLAASRNEASTEAGGSETESDSPVAVRAVALTQSATAAAAAGPPAPADDVNAFVVASAAQSGTPTTAAAVVATAPAPSVPSSGKNGVSIPTAPAPIAGANANAGATAGGANGASGAQQRMQFFDSKRMTRVSFNSWFDFDSYFEMYMQETFQPFRMRSSCSVEAYRRNQQKVMMNNKTSRGRRTEFPDEAIHHHRIYMCTHAMKARCRGATTRPGQKYRGIGCIAKINVKITPADNDSKYMVIVTDQVVTHNHPVSREIYEAYPDVLLKMMRRSQLSQSMLGRPALPKFETPSQVHKYERVMNTLHAVAEQMARMSDEEYEQQLAQLQRIYSGAVGDQQTSSSV